MDGEVRVMRADVPSRDVASSHTLHNVFPLSAGISASSEAPLSRRERLLQATVEAVSEGSVDRLHRTRDSRKAL
jgi:hypothetical protein